LQFAQINKKFQSDVKKKRIVQRSELNVLGNKKKTFENWAKAIEKNCNYSVTSIQTDCY